MYYTIYKTTNLLNGKYYIGKHQTENINDTYYGSGVLLETAIKKYGKENFKKEILFVFDNESDMNQKEKELVNESIVKDKNTYNMGLGGEGGAMFLGKHHSKKTKQKISEIMKNRPPMTEEAKQKISEIMKNRIFSEETKQKISNKMKMIHSSEEWRNKISNIMTLHYDKIGRKGKRRNHKRDLVCNIDNTSKKRVHIYKDNLSYRVYEEELNHYLKNGWNIGRNNNFKNKVSNKLKGKGCGSSNSVYGRKWMYNDELHQCQMIKEEDIKKFLINGWQFGNKNKEYKKDKNYSVQID